ncbi:MAG: hypothetical protein LBT76_01955 [Tannerella sp.]|jgi:hypothetical protein|nr:hypothetical protein [Tannerella sp.]
MTSYSTLEKLFARGDGTFTAVKIDTIFHRIYIQNRHSIAQNRRKIQRFKDSKINSPAIEKFKDSRFKNSNDEHFPFTRQNFVFLPFPVCKPSKTVFSPSELPAAPKNRFSARRNFPQLPKIVFQACGTSRSSQKSFFKPAELPAAPKNHFSSLRNFPQLSKTVFQPVGTSRSSQKSFFTPAELPAALKNRFSSLRNFPQLLKIVFQPGGTSRCVKYSINV